MTFFFLIGRYGAWVDWVDEGVRYDGELQVEATGGAECQRGCGDDHPVHFLVLEMEILAYLVV